LWMAWHYLEVDPDTGAINPLSSAIKLAYYTETSGTWTVDEDGYILDSAVHLEMALDCVGTRLLLAVCASTSEDGLVAPCRIKVLWRDLPHVKWEIYTTNVETYAHDTQDLAIGHTDTFTIIAWVTKFGHIGFSWAKSSEPDVWEEQRIVEGSRSERLGSSLPSFGCGSQVCYLTYLVGDHLARILKFVPCTDTEGEPCIWNGRITMHVPPAYRRPVTPGTPQPQPEPSTVPHTPIPPPVIVSNPDELIFIIGVVGVIAFFCLVGGITLCLMARNKSGCFAPREYLPPSAQQEQQPLGEANDGSDDTEVELESK